MKKLNYLMTILSLILIGCGNPKSNENKTTDNIRIKEFQSVIPEKLEKYLKVELPAFQIATQDKYVSGWKEFTEPSIIPYYCSSDFNGDGKIDYSLVLTNENNVYLFAFLSSENSFTSSPIDTFHYSPKGVDAIISITKKGEYEMIDETVKIPFDGISIQLILDSKEWTYYWDGKNFKRLLFD